MMELLLRGSNYAGDRNNKKSTFAYMYTLCNSYVR